MSSFRDLLKIGDRLRIRSSKAFTVRKNSAALIADKPAIYSFESEEPQKLLLLAGDEYALTEGADERRQQATIVGGAVFFDQVPYIFKIYLPQAQEAWFFSPLATLCDNSDWDSETNILTLPLNFGNDLGDFQLCWEWRNEEGELCSESFSAQVFSSKLDIYSHFQWMLKEVSERFASWIKLDLLRQTSWGWQEGGDSEADLHSWLLIFQQVRQKMEQCLLRLELQHRRRLVAETHQLRADRILKTNRRLEERLAEGMKDNSNRRYAVQRRVLHCDTPENRYMKHLLMQTLNQLNEVIDRIEPIERISEVFKQRLQQWADDWSQLKEHRFWKGIGAFQGLRKESLVLSQDPLYSGVRSSWFLLQQGLEFLDRDLKGGIQNAAQLYEIWCLVKMVQLLQEEGWTCESQNPQAFERDEEELFSEEEIRTGAVRFSWTKKGVEKVQLDLLFQPTAGSRPQDSGIWEGMMAAPVEQKPDIVLRLHRKDLPSQPVYSWIFDAKYRIRGNNAPEDAVNQMHRYRDAVIWSAQTCEKTASDLTRESIGAYVLYPGDAEQAGKFPQIESISRTNIGAFPLRPTEQGNLPPQLQEKLREFLTISKKYSDVEEQQEMYYASVPAVKTRTELLHIRCVTRSNDKMNTAEYWKKCRLYRLPCKQLQGKHIDFSQWGYLIPLSSRKGKALGNFPILTPPIKLKRRELRERYLQAGVKMYDSADRASDEYWLFELGDPLEDMPAIEDLSANQVFSIVENPLVEDIHDRRRMGGKIPSEKKPY